MNTPQMALIGYQAERHKIEEKIAEIRATNERRLMEVSPGIFEPLKSRSRYATRELRSRYRGIADQQTGEVPEAMETRWPMYAVR